MHLDLVSGHDVIVPRVSPLSCGLWKERFCIDAPIEITDFSLDEIDQIVVGDEGDAMERGARPQAIRLGREMGKEVMEHYTETKAVAAKL